MFTHKHFFVRQTIVESRKDFSFLFRPHQIIPETFDFGSSVPDEHAHPLPLHLQHAFQLELVCPDVLCRRAPIELDKVVNIRIGNSQSFPQDFELVVQSLDLRFAAGLFFLQLQEKVS